MCINIDGGVYATLSSGRDCFKERAPFNPYTPPPAHLRRSLLLIRNNRRYYCVVYMFRLIFCQLRSDASSPGQAKVQAAPTASIAKKYDNLYFGPARPEMNKCERETEDQASSLRSDAAATTTL